MEEKRALFVPRNRYGGYKIAIEVIPVGQTSRVYLRPAPGDSYYLEDHLFELLDIDPPKERQFPFWVGKVQIFMVHVPEYEIQLVRDRRVMTYDQVVEFLSGFDSLSRA